MSKRMPVFFSFNIRMASSSTPDRARKIVADHGNQPAYALIRYSGSVESQKKARTEIAFAGLCASGVHRGG
jgi:hypothetical protein